MTFFGSFGRREDPAAARILAPALHAESGVTVALLGGPVWIEGIPAREPARDILAAYQRLGAQLLPRLTGRFALALDDRNENQVVLALDRMGMERVAYAISDGSVVFSTSAEAVARHPRINASLRSQALFDCMLLHMVPAPETAYEGVFKLRPGTCLIWKDGKARVERYWKPEFATRPQASFAELQRDLLKALADGVAACEPDDDTGAFLSGGLDSSSVAGMLCKVRGKPARTFSMGFGVDEFNELEYARIASKHFGAIAHEYTVTADDIVEAFTVLAGAFDEPFGNSSSVPTYLCARFAARHGVKHLLAGDGGDEIFGGNERYVRQRVFEVYRALPESLRARVIEPLVTRIIGTDNPITPLRKFRSYVDQASIPLPERLESWNFMYRTDMSTMLEPDFRASIDTRAPLRTMAEVYGASPGHSMLQHMLFYDWHYTLSDNDLRKVGTACELAGVRVSYPMLDPRMIDVSLRVAPSVMIKGLELRSFYKQAMRGFLPDEILLKKKHGFGLPFGVWLKTHQPLRELIYGLLSALKGRRLVKATFLDELIASHQQGHAGYFGYAIWDLAMLEAWLQAHPGFTLSWRSAA
jgi:asparagine synthase (glutamine-hydrolysing)